MTEARTIDFSRVKSVPRFKTGREKSLSPKQLRARARRLAEKGKSPANELELLYKPIEQWDAEELAKGRPRAVDGTFKGRPPTWVTRELYEQAMSRFTQVIREQVQTEAAGALGVVKMLMESEEVDDKGKPLVPASVKLDAAKWLTEHVIGKPTQRVEQDISVKLQAVLGQVMWTPGMPAPALMGPVQPVIQSTPETADGVWDVDGYSDDDD
jgi:hypothetical protein